MNPIRRSFAKGVGIAGVGMVIAGVMVGMALPLLVFGTFMFFGSIWELMTIDSIEFYETRL